MTRPGWSDAAALAERGLQRARTSNGVSYAAGGAGPPLVLLHGGSGAWNHWLANVAPLCARFRVAALDLPGFGLSDAPDPEIANAGYVALTAAAIAEIAGDDAVHLSGFSFGGFLAACLAGTLGAQVASLSMTGPNGFPPPLDRPANLYGPRTLGRRLGRTPTDADLREMHRNNLSEIMLSRPAPIDDPLVDMHMWNVKRTRFDSRRLSWSGEMATLFPGLTVDTLLIYGELDRSQNPTIRVRMDELRQLRPEIEILALPGVGHWAMYEAAGDVNAALARFHGGSARA